MKPVFYHDIFNACKAMHQKYGTGQIVAGVAALGVGQIHLTIKSDGRKAREIVARYDGSTLEMYGRQLRVTIV